MQIGILTGGGDAPGLNAAIRGVARSAFADGVDVLGVRNGWAGLVDDGDASPAAPCGRVGDPRPGRHDPGHLAGQPPGGPGAMDAVIANIGRLGIDALVTIGGDDTLSVGAALAERGVPVVGVPKTVDNDLLVTEYCIGFDTAVAIVTEAVDRLHTTAASHHRVMVVEAMGREAGWVTLMGGLAGGADMIIIPEFAVGLDEVVDHLNARRKQGKTFSIIAVSEGAEVGGLPTAVRQRVRLLTPSGTPSSASRGIGERLGRQVEDVTGFETRVTVLGHTQRGGTPTAYDRIWATRVGVARLQVDQRGALR